MFLLLHICTLFAAPRGRHCAEWGWLMPLLSANALLPATVVSVPPSDLYISRTILCSSVLFFFNSPLFLIYPHCVQSYYFISFPCCQSTEFDPTVRHKYLQIPQLMDSSVVTQLVARFLTLSTRLPGISLHKTDSQVYLWSEFTKLL